MVYITQNTFIDFIHVNKDYRSNPSTQEDKVTLKQAPELQTIRCTKCGPKHHACKDRRNACNMLARIEENTGSTILSICCSHLCGIPLMSSEMP